MNSALVQRVAGALAVIGALNWGLVAIAEFDLVAEIFGLQFGETNAITRVIYGLVGLSGLVLAAHDGRPRAPHRRQPPLVTAGSTDRRTTPRCTVAGARPRGCVNGPFLRRISPRRRARASRSDPVARWRP